MAVANNDPIDLAVGSRIRFQRRHQGLTQTQLAEAIGITFQQIQKYERGSNRVSASVLVKIAARLDTSVAALVGEGEAVRVPPIALVQLGTPGAAELLAAYARIDNSEVRRAIVAVAEAVAKDRTKPQAMAA